jgi:hypothetical protein
MMNYA